MVIIDTDNNEYIKLILEKYPFELGSGKISDGRFELKCDYAGEIRFGPPYYKVNIFENEIKIWENYIYGGELFCQDILSAKFNKLILVKWHSLSPNDETIVEIDLISKKEKEITKKSRYHFAGHFNSFDGIFYSEFGINNIICKDLVTDESFLINELITKYINNVINWGISSIDNTILVLSQNLNKFTITVFNVKLKRIEDEGQFEFNVSDNVSFNFFLDKDNKKSLLEISDYDLLEDRTIINDRKYYKLIKF